MHNLKIEDIVIIAIVILLLAAVPFYLIKYSKSPRERRFMVRVSIPWAMAPLLAPPLNSVFPQAHVSVIYGVVNASLAIYMFAKRHQIRETEKTSA